jgi:NADPH2 dehydrogenase
MTDLFSSFECKQLVLRNRVVMPPMCQYSVEAKDGKPNDWHLVHYASRAVGGTGLIIMEMTDVEPDGRISDYDLGLWSDDQVPSFARIVEAVHQHGAQIAVQIAHAGRKALDAAVPVSASELPFDAKSKTPRALTTDEVKRMVEKFRDSAKRALDAGMDSVELHGAHGYLIHQFHSPLTNRRQDEYGEDPARFGIEVIQAVRSVLPSTMPLLMRVSAVEYVDGGYGLDYSTELCKRYQEAGVDLFHISSGGEGPIGSGGAPGVGPGYQVPYARGIREALDVPVIAVGLLDDPVQANAVIANEDADLVAVGRGMLRDPYWALHAAVSLGRKPEAPKAYARAF